MSFCMILVKRIVPYVHSLFVQCASLPTDVLGLLVYCEGAPCVGQRLTCAQILQQTNFPFHMVSATLAVRRSYNAMKSNFMLRAAGAMQACTTSVVSIALFRVVSACSGASLVTIPRMPVHGCLKIRGRNQKFQATQMRTSVRRVVWMMRPCACASKKW